MVIIPIIAMQLLVWMFFYPLLVTGKREDEIMEQLAAKKVQENQLIIVEGKNVESQREALRMIENEIRKGSAPVQFQEMKITQDSYELVESQAKLNLLLEYLFRLGEFAGTADKQVKNNMYMDVTGKKPDFRTAKSEFDRKKLQIAVKRWIKKKNPSFDGDVYLETARCYLVPCNEEQEFSPDNLLKFSKKHLIGLYLQCLITRKEIMLQMVDDTYFSEVCSRIFELENVDVLFQCLLIDRMEWTENKWCCDFCTVYIVNK